MRKLITFLVLMAFINAVSAVTITNQASLKNSGPNIGFKNKGAIQAQDLYATDDAKVGDDMQVVGDLAVTGALSYGSGNFSSGTYDDDLRLLANHSFYSTAGSGGIDWSNGTGVLSTPTGTNTLNGNVVIAGAKTFTTGTGAIALNGDTTIAATKGITKTTGAGNFDFSAGTGFFNTTTGTNYINGAVTMASGKSLTQAGASGITVGTTGITATASPLKLLENVTISANKNLVTSGTGTITSAATITGEQLTSTDDANITNNLYLGDTLYVADIIQSNDAQFASVDITTALDVNSAATMRDVTLDANKNLTMSGTGTVTTGTGAVSLAGDTTVASNKALAVTTADKLTVGGVIVPQEMVVTIPLSSVAAERNNSACFIASDAWQITHIEEAHPVAESGAATLTADVIKMTGTQALTGGVNLTEAAFNLKGTANTVQAGAVSTTSGVATLADGNRIGVIINMTAVSNPAQFVNGGISIHMKRV